MQQLLTAKLGRPLEEVVREMRGDACTWVSIANSIRRRTGVQVSDESLRVWFADRFETAARTA